MTDINFKSTRCRILMHALVNSTEARRFMRAVNKAEHVANHLYAFNEEKKDQAVMENIGFLPCTLIVRRH